MSIRSAARNLRRATRNASSGVDRRGSASAARARWRRVRLCVAVDSREGTVRACHVGGTVVTTVQQFRAVLQTAKLNILDELYLHLDRDDEPFSVHMEVQVE